MEKEMRDKVLQHFPYGLFVIGSANGRRVSTIVANWVTQVSFSPPLVAIAIEADSRMREVISSTGSFSINMLAPKDTDAARAFLKPKETEGDEINGRRFMRAARGTPFFEVAVASIECRVVAAHVTGDHVMFVGEVTDGAIHTEGGGDILTLRETGWRYQR